MAFPTGTETVELTFGLYFDALGKPISNEWITIECDAAPIVTSAGDVLVRRSVDFPIVNGVATATLVASDAEAVGDRAGFTYTVTLPDSLGIEPRSVVLPASVPSVDFDSLIPSDSSEGGAWSPPATDDSIATLIRTDGAEARAAVLEIVDGGGTSGGVTANYVEAKLREHVDAPNPHTSFKNVPSYAQAFRVALI